MAFEVCCGYLRYGCAPRRGAGRAGASRIRPEPPQGAGAFTGYNDVRIPGDSGTELSFSDDLGADGVFSGRFEVGYIRRDRDYFGVMAAPLRVDSRGRVDRDVDFAGTRFPAGTPLEGTFRFDSYRLTWRRKFAPWESFDLWLGLTLKVRDAAITLEGGGLRAEKANTGFVPLINFLAEWRFAPPWSLRVAGDALAASQGRAEDVLIAAVRYSGSWSERGYLRHKSELASWMRAKGLASAGEPQWARYNSPFSLWFLRRNEILVLVATSAD